MKYQQKGKRINKWEKNSKAMRNVLFNIFIPTLVKKDDKIMVVDGENLRYFTTYKQYVWFWYNIIYKFEINDK